MFDERGSALVEAELAGLDVGEPIGGYENSPGSSAGAIVIGADGLLVLDEHGERSQSIRYDEIDHWDRLSKDPVSRSLVIWGRAACGSIFPSSPGRATLFSFVQFLIPAIRQHRG